MNRKLKMIESMGLEDRFDESLRHIDYPIAYASEQLQRLMDLPAFHVLLDAPSSDYETLELALEILLNYRRMLQARLTDRGWKEDERGWYREERKEA